VCLAIPGRIVEIVDEEKRLAKAEVSGVRRTISVGLLDEVQIGDWVLIHVGFAIQKVDEAEARRTLDFLRQLGQTYQDEVRQFAESQIEG
jgi:hydrogenase expression/formation protein HypC